MKKIVKVFMLALLTVCTVSLTSCGEYDTAQEKYHEAVNHLSHLIYNNITPTSCECYVYRGTYYFSITFSYVEEDYLGTYNDVASKDIFVDEDGNITCSDCYNYEAQNAFNTYSLGTEIVIKELAGYEPQEIAIIFKEIEIYFNNLKKHE